MSPTIADRIRRRLQPRYTRTEAAWLARILMCEVLGQREVDYYAGKDRPLSPTEAQSLAHILARLDRHEPIDYILGHRRFCGLDFRVGPAVLIPRPETEELMEIILDQEPASGRAIDIGTGSGCMAVSLSVGKPGWEVDAVDISPEALAMARDNNARLGGKVRMWQADVLTWTPEPALHHAYDCLMSNPPYVPMSQRAGMQTRVADHEPAIALFVPDADPLRFYRAIARLGRTLLKDQGRIYLEINQDHGQDILRLLATHNYHNAQLRKDLSGNDRFITATL